MLEDAHETPLQVLRELGLERDANIPTANTDMQCACLGGMTSVRWDRTQVWGLCVQLWEGV